MTTNRWKERWVQTLAALGFSVCLQVSGAKSGLHPWIELHVLQRQITFSRIPFVFCPLRLQFINVQEPEPVCRGHCQSECNNKASHKTPVLHTVFYCLYYLDFPLCKSAQNHKSLLKELKAVITVWMTVCTVRGQDCLSVLRGCAH